MHLLPLYHHLKLIFHRSGGKRVKKLSFGNALSNVGSQDLWNDCKLDSIANKQLTKNVTVHTTTSKTGILKASGKAFNVKSDSTNKNKRRLRWADGSHVDCKLLTASPLLCKIKEIPLELWKKTGPDVGSQIDKGDMVGRAIYNNLLKNFSASTVPRENFCGPVKSGDSYQMLQTLNPVYAPTCNSVPSNPCGALVDTSRICTRSDIIVKILRWMPQWLEEQKNQRDEPEVEGKGWQLNPVPSVYSSFKDYCNVVYPLMLHELWSSVFRDFSDQQAAVPSLGLKRPPILACLTEQSTSSRRTHTINLTSLMSYDESKLERDGCLPTKGWLVILDLTFIKIDVVTGMRKSQQKKKFGFVEGFRIHRRSNNHGNIYIDQLERARVQLGVPKQNLEYVMELAVSIKYLDTNVEGQLDLTKMVVINSISRIEPTLRLFKAVEEAPISPLFQNILRPKEKNFYLGMDTDIMPAIKLTIPQYADLNIEQNRVVASVARMCTTNPTLPQMGVVHGPPGTGKSTTMVALILQIFAKSKNQNQLPRILLTAPSNTAVDELLKKLKAVKKQLNSSQSQIPKFRMVRIGEEKKIHPDVKDYRLETLRDNEVNKRIKDKSIGDTLQEEIQRRQNAINRLGQELANATADPPKSRILHKRIREEELALGLAKRNQENDHTHHKEKERLRREVTDSILASADIVATTLNR